MTTRSNMLPSALLEEPGAKRTARDWLVDLTMLLVAMGIGLLAFEPTEDQHSDLMALIDVLCGVVGWIALWWRRRWPVAVAVLTLGLSTISAFVAGAALIALFNVALRSSRRALVLTTAFGLTTAAIFSLIYPDPDLPFAIAVLLSCLITLFVVPWGLFTRAQRDLLRSTRERTRQLESEQRAHVEQAREAERRRIAGEMHDVLAHRLSLLSVHAGALEFRPDATPEEIAEAAGVIRANAHEALQDLRDVIGVLRSEAAGVQPPQPTLDAIPSLIEESRAAGMKVRARMDAEGGDMLLGRTAYRVVQEGLTNARKHAPAAAVEVTVAAADELVVEVVSRRPAHPVAAEPGGSGLIGLAERVELVGGALEHGQNLRGDFVLRATLPLGHVIRVLLVDDDALVRSGLKMMLAGAAGIEVVGEAGDGREVLAAVDRHRPDVVLMDIRMPAVDGIEATRLVRGQPSPPSVIVLTTFDADELVLRALRAGAAGFLLKDTPPPEIVRAIEHVHAGESMLSPTVTRQLIAMVAGEDGGRREQARARLETLSAREREVACAVGRGAANAEIAAELHMSVATVKAHVSRVLVKLEVENRVQVALLVQDAS